MEPGGKPPVVAEYEVGYGKPPKVNRFKKGRSGNPAGRPKGAKNSQSTQIDRFREMVLEESYREIPLREDGVVREVPVARAVIRSLGLKAAKGNASAQRLFVEVTAAAEGDLKQEIDTGIRSAIRYQERTRALINSYKAANKTPPEIVPHPDHIDIDLVRMEITFTGPTSDADKRDWDGAWKVKRKFETGVAEVQRFYDENYEILTEQQREELIEMINNNRYIVLLTDLCLMNRWNVPSQRLTDDPEYRFHLDELYHKGERPPLPSGLMDEPE